MAIKYYTGIDLSGDLIPAADSTHDIGSSSVRFANIYADTLYGDGSNIINLADTQISYDNTHSGMAATTVHSAIDELYDEKLDRTALTSAVSFYPTTTSSTITNYYKLVTSPDDADYDDTAVDVATGLITGQDQLVGSLASEPGVLEGNTGIINIHTVGNIKLNNGANDTASFYFKVFHRNSSGTETLMGTSSTTPAVSSSTYQEFSADALISATTFTATDRVVLKFYGSKTGNNQDPNYHFQYGGASPVRSQFPVPVSVVPTENDAEDIIVSTTNFSGLLSSADDDVQAALETLDGITKSDIGLGNVANTTITVTSSSVSDGTNTFNKYTLPAATASVRGGITVGDNLNIVGDELSAVTQTDNNFTNALKTKLDGIETGATSNEDAAIYNASGTPAFHPDITAAEVRLLLDVDQSGTNNYTLPTATDSVLGGVKIGSGITITSGVISADDQTSGLAPLASPAFTGNPTAPTQTAGNNTTRLATTAFVQTAVSNLVDSAPAALDTLNELAAALGDDANFSTTVNTALGNRVRVDTASQGLNSTEKSNARTNIDAAASSHNHSAANITSGTLDLARIPASLTSRTSVTATHFKGTLTTVTKTGNKVPLNLNTQTNIYCDIGGTFSGYTLATLNADAVGNSGTIILHNSSAVTLGTPFSNVLEFKTPNGDGIDYDLTSGSTAILSYFVVSTSVVLINYIGNYQ